MNLEDFYSPGLVREVDRDSSVEAARSEESVVQNISSVRRGNHDDARVAGEAVHLREDLVQRLFPFVVRREASTAGALAADGVDFVDEDDARRVLFGISKERTNARRTDADEHLDELRTRTRNEGHA